MILLSYFVMIALVLGLLKMSGKRNQSTGIGIFLMFAAVAHEIIRLSNHLPFPPNPLQPMAFISGFMVSLLGLNATYHQRTLR